MENHKYRFNWNSPIALGHDGQTVYFGGNVLFKSTNHGQSWDVISPDLTTNDKSKQKSSGGPIVVDNTAAEFHCTILTIAPSPIDPNVIWVGTDDGNVQVTRDGGKTWTNVVKNIQGLAPNAWIPTIDASPLRRRHGVRRRRSSPGQRLHGVLLQDDRLRQDLDAAEPEPAGDQDRLVARHPRGSEEPQRCSTPAPSSGSGCRSTPARTGRRCGRTCRRCRSATSRSIRATTI